MIASPAAVAQRIEAARRTPLEPDALPLEGGVTAETRYTSITHPTIATARRSPRVPARMAHDLHPWRTGRWISKVQRRNDRTRRLIARPDHTTASTRMRHESLRSPRSCLLGEWCAHRLTFPVRNVRPNPGPVQAATARLAVAKASWPASRRVGRGSAYRAGHPVGARR